MTRPTLKNNSSRETRLVKTFTGIDVREFDSMLQEKPYAVVCKAEERGT